VSSLPCHVVERKGRVGRRQDPRRDRG
jgi:hypothetical protein